MYKFRMWSDINGIDTSVSAIIRLV